MNFYLYSYLIKKLLRKFIKPIFLSFLLFLITYNVPAKEIPVSRSYYVGMLGTSIALQMDISFIPQSDLFSGTLYYEILDIGYSMEGRIDPWGNVTFDVINQNGKTIGLILGRFTPSKETFKGRWHSKNKKRSFTLKQVAKYISLDSKFDKIKSKNVYPRFSSPSPRMLSINKFLKKTGWRAHNEFIKDAEEGIVFDKREFLQWEQDNEYSIKYYSDEILSLLETTYAFTGGAHGNTYYSSKNIWIKNNKAVSLKLSDLFLQNKKFIEKLSDYCIKELRNQEAGWIISGDITKLDTGDLKIFTLSPRSITFYFPPYHVGCYAEGTHRVRVPYFLLKDIINPEGPLGQFLK